MEIILERIVMGGTVGLVFNIITVLLSKPANKR